MTDPHDHLDELASAHLDGTTSTDEAALLAADPTLRQRVEVRAEELRAVRHALAGLPPVDPARRDAAIAAALAAFDADGSVARAGATVTPLAPRRGLSPRAVRVLSAAAVVLLLALLVPLLACNDGDDETASFESTGDAIDSAGGGTADGAAEDTDRASNPLGQAESGGVTGSEAPGFRYVGSYDDLDALAAAVASGQQRTADAAFDAGRDDSLCEGPPPAASTMSLAEVAGEPVEVYVHTSTDGTRTMIVRASDTCEQLDERVL